MSIYTSRFAAGMEQVLSAVSAMVDEINASYGEGEGTGMDMFDIVRESSDMRDQINELMRALSAAQSQLDNAYRTRVRKDGGAVDTKDMSTLDAEMRSDPTENEEKGDEPALVKSAGAHQFYR